MLTRSVSEASLAYASGWCSTSAHADSSSCVPHCGCRLDGWRECFKPDIWWQTFADLGIDPGWYSQRLRPMTEVLPWDHVNVKKGRAYLEKEQNRSLTQLEVMAKAE